MKKTFLFKHLHFTYDVPTIPKPPIYIKVQPESQDDDFYVKLQDLRREDAVVNCPGISYKFVYTLLSLRVAPPIVRSNPPPVITIHDTPVVTNTVATTYILI
jgi:hypothetical protein